MNEEFNIDEADAVLAMQPRPHVCYKALGLLRAALVEIRKLREERDLYRQGMKTYRRALEIERIPVRADQRKKEEESGIL